MNLKTYPLFKVLMIYCLNTVYFNTYAQEVNFNYLIERGVEAAIQCGQFCNVTRNNYYIYEDQDRNSDLIKSIKFSYEISDIIRPTLIEYLDISPNEVDTLVIPDWYDKKNTLNLFGTTSLTYLEAVDKENDIRANLESEGHMHFLVKPVIYRHGNYMDVQLVPYCDGYITHGIVIRFKKIIPTGYLPEVYFNLLGYIAGELRRGFIKSAFYVSGCVPVHWVKDPRQKD